MKHIVALSLVILLFTGSIAYAAQKAAPELYSDTVRAKSGPDTMTDYDTSQLLNLYILDLVTLGKDIKAQNDKIVGLLEQLVQLTATQAQKQ